ncbi:uncharacterized protein CANTADRAFT_143312 [Suhomyces tanzawaensis NRRL Y-17324]|uniref:Uncharacterized protein n=1 Tax=Suhomyces tanzawaensis NRRL Y-17324 TaxID=984487 RepID=A0A1E4SSK5_9ASCO|nr:uncharacterized protein CANTADRAFT_143312 [Suhomyces tanzawaensis NRRL Y-17324]ODV82372.1 hypothetical protein CANTADRAFT_143312 [Suhomyces tanzawaensis NRRL Y-17324]
MFLGVFKGLVVYYAGHRAHCVFPTPVLLGGGRGSWCIVLLTVQLTPGWSSVVGTITRHLPTVSSGNSLVYCFRYPQLCCPGNGLVQ